MRWFKHFADAHRGQSIQALFDKFGHVGPCCYWILVEMCAEKLDENLEKRRGERVTEDDCRFVFHDRILRQNLRVSATKVRRMLDECSTLDLLSFQISDNSVKIFMPKLLKCLERAKKKDVRTTSARRPNDVLDIDIEIDKELENTETPVSPAEPEPEKPNPNLLVEVWNSDRGPFSRVEKFTDGRKSKAKTQLAKYPDVAHWREVLARWKRSEFCTATWKPTFDDWLSESKRIATLEGRYDDRNARHSNKNAPLAIRYPDASTLPAPPSPESRDGGPEAAAKVREQLAKVFKYRPA